MYSSLPDTEPPAMQFLSHQASGDTDPCVSVDTKRGSAQIFLLLQTPAVIWTSPTVPASITPMHATTLTSSTQFHLTTDITSARTLATRVTKDWVAASTSLRNKWRCYTCAMMDCPGTAHRSACAGWKREEYSNNCKNCLSARAMHSNATTNIVN